MTLGEMLVVAIVAVLAAVLFPVFAQSKGGPKKTPLCLLNLKQSDLAGLQYTSDHDDRFPLRDRWMDAFNPYLKSEAVLHCDAVPKGAYRYAFNAALSGAKLDSGSSHRPFLYDSVNPIRNASDRVASLPSPGRHRRGKAGGNYIAYEDAHAKWVSGEEKR